MSKAAALSICIINVSKMYPINIGKDKQINVFFRPILFSKKKAKGPTQAAAKGNMGPIHEAVSSEILRSQSG